MADTPRRRGRPKAFNSDPAQVSIQALDRALDVLDLLSQREGMTLSAIAATLDQSVATIHRVLATLEARHFVEISPEGQLWHIGAGAFRVGSGFLRRSNVQERSRPAMHDLMQRTGETANLGVGWRGQVLFVSQVETHEAIRAFFPPGTLAPLHCSGIGKALLAEYDEPRLNDVLAGLPTTGFTPRTITDAGRLRDELARIRAQGFAVDDEERAIGMRCVAAVIRNSFGEAVAGVSVSGAAQRMTPPRLPQLGQLVRDTANRISAQIGYLAPPPA